MTLTFELDRSNLQLDQGSKLYVYFPKWFQSQNQDPNSITCHWKHNQSRTTHSLKTNWISGSDTEGPILGLTTLVEDQFLKMGALGTITCEGITTPQALPSSDRINPFLHPANGLSEDDELTDSFGLVIMKPDNKKSLLELPIILDTDLTSKP